VSLLAELNSILEAANLPVETGIFSGTPPDKYAVLTPLYDSFPLSADDRPLFETQEVRVSLYTKMNYLSLKKTLTKAFLDGGITITERRYLGIDTGYHQYFFDTEKVFILED
jgi:hypothetical protein